MAAGMGIQATRGLNGLPISPWAGLGVLPPGPRALVLGGLRCVCGTRRRMWAAMVGAIGAYPDGSEHAFEVRTFAPGLGVAEDPVCGSMNASVTGCIHGTITL